MPAPQPQPVQPDDENPFLSPEERKQIGRYLSFPEEFPKKFGSWIAEHVAVNGLEIPVSQIRGFNQFQARSAKLTGGLQGTSSTAYGDLSTVGPTLSGLGDGQWIFLHGAYVDEDASAKAFMSISVNGAAASDTDAASIGVDGPGGEEVRGTIMTANYKVLKKGGSNEVKAKYRVGAGTANFNNRWIIGVRVGN